MPNDISSTSIPNELAVLIEFMLSHHTVRLDQFFIILFFLFHFFCTFSIFLFLYSSVLPQFF